MSDFGIHFPPGSSVCHPESVPVGYPCHRGSPVNGKQRKREKMVRHIKCDYLLSQPEGFFIVKRCHWESVVFVIRQLYLNGEGDSRPFNKLSANMPEIDMNILARKRFSDRMLTPSMGVSYPPN